MTDAPIQTKKVEIVKEDDKLKALEPLIAKALVNLEKKDYRATIIQRLEAGQVPDAMTAFIDIDRDKVNAFGYNRDLDIKGTITPFQHYFNQSARFLTALAQLKDWEYVERINEDGEIEQIPIDLVQLDAEEGRSLSMALFGNQSEKEIRLMRAGFGMNEETTADKAAKWFGLVRRKKSDVYLDNEVSRQ